MIKGFIRVLVNQTWKPWYRKWRKEYRLHRLDSCFDYVMAHVPLTILPTKMNGGYRAKKRLNKMLPIGHRVRGDVAV